MAQTMEQRSQPAADSAVSVQRIADRVVVTVRARAEERRHAYLSTAAGCALTAIGPVLAGYFFGWLPMLLFGIPLLAVIFAGLTQIDRLSRAYRFEAGPDGLLVESTGPFGHKSRQFERRAIKDVRALRVSSRPYNHALMRVVPAKRWPAPGNNYLTGMALPDVTQAVDAVREGLGMTPENDGREQIPALE